jgi:flagella basal body P-ring formation protein FlgA
VKTLVVAALLLTAARPAAAESLDDIIRAELSPSLDANLGVSEVHLTPALAKLDLDRAMVEVEIPRDVRVGRQSVKLTLRGKHAHTEYVPVSFARLVDVAIVQHPMGAGAVITAGDISVERRAVGQIVPAPVGELVGSVVNHDLTAGAVIANHDVSLPAPLARGTQVVVDVRRGSVHVHGTGVLELAARPGQPATVRVAATNTLVHGTLVSPSTVVVGDVP